MRIPTFVQTLLTDYFRWTAGAVMVLIVALGYFLILDSKIEELRTSGLLERTRVEAELTSQREYLSKLKSSLEKFKSSLTTENLKGIDTFIPTGEDFPGLLLTIEDIARSANLALDSINVNSVGAVVSTNSTAATGSPESGTVQAATATGLNLQTVDITVTVSGGTSYEAFKTFITQIESSRRLFDVVSLNFSSAKKSEEGAQVIPYNVVLRAYYLPTT